MEFESGTQLIAKAEALEEVAKELQFKAAQYRLQARKLMSNFPEQVDKN